MPASIAARFVPSIDATFREQLAAVLPAGIDVNAVASASLTVGLVGLVVLLYAGVRWVGSLRRGLFLIWGAEPRDLPFVKGLVRDILTLLLLGACLLVSLAVTVVVSWSTGALSRHFALGGWWLDVGVRLLGLAVSLATDLAGFFLVYRGLPPRTTSTRSLLRGAMLAAVGFELLKQAAALVVSGGSTNVIYGTFAATVGLLVWIGYASRLLLMAGAWVVTSEPPPAPAAARPSAPA